MEQKMLLRRKAALREKEIEILNHEEDKEFNLKVSSASFHLNDVIGFIFGGQSSRFWMLRKHMINLNHSQKMPFYAWECITLQLVHREVDLVIPNESDMLDLLMILIDHLKTVDGKKGSQIHVENAILIHKKELKEHQKNLKVHITSDEKNKIYQATLMKLKIMKIRSKISLMAFEKNKSVNELFLD
jgi:hypothetical protein